MTNLALHDERRQFNSSTLSRSTLGDSPPGDRFVILSNDPTATLCYEPDKWSHDDYIRDLELQLRRAGPVDPFYEKGFVGLRDRRTIEHNPETENDAPSSTKRIRHLPIRRSSLAILLEACPSLDSDHGSSNETEYGDGTTAPEVSSGNPTVSGGSSLSHAGPSLHATLRRAFSSEPSFAERVITAVNQLPTHKREFLVGYNTECVDGSSSNPSKSDGRPPKKRRITSKKSNKGDGGSRSNGNGSGGSGGGGDGEEEEEEEEEEGDGTSSSATQKREKKNPGLNCPWNLAYPEIHGIPRFNHCSSANMFEQNVWRLHLNTHHSPESKLNDRNSEQHAKFYMSPQKSDAVQRIFGLDLYKKRPRDPEKRTDQLKELFDGVWCTIFPSDEFTDLRKPLSPFHIDRREIANLEQHLASRAQILVETIYKTKADEAFDTGTIQSRSEYLPTAEQMTDIMSKALAVILLSSPASTGATQWLARAPLDAIEVAGKQWKDNSVSQSLSSQLEEQAAPNDGTPLIPPTPTTMPEILQLAPGGIDAIDTLPVPLLPNGTLLELKPRDASLPQGNTGNAYLNLPSTHYVASTRPVPLPLWPMGPNHMINPIPHNPSYATQPMTDFTSDIYG